MGIIEVLKILRYRLFYCLIERKRSDLVKLGGECPWTILPTLGPSSHVLCAGAGHDISFELALLRRFHCQIRLLDPSPTGNATWQRESERAQGQIFFHPVALAGKDGQILIGPPADTIEGSFRSLPRNATDCFKVPSRSPASLMRDWGWNAIDLLKIDIEGAEFAVLDSLLREDVRVGQICVEFHHGQDFAATAKDSREAILRLLRRGYRLVHHIHWDHTFVHRSLL